MHKNQIWLAFLSILGLIVIGYTWLVGYDIIQYLTLTEKTAPKEIEWKLHYQASDHIVVQADYTYRVNNQTFKGAYQFRETPYMNPWAAKEGIEEWKDQQWRVYYSRSNPSNSKLENTFPLKSAAYAAILWTILAYFIGLGYYVQKRKK